MDPFQILLTLIPLFFGTTKSDRTFNENDIPELVYLDTTIDPCDNFYKFTCGNFAKVHTRPSTTNILDQFTLVETDLVKIGKDILSSPIDGEDPIAVKKAKKAYRSCVNVRLQNNAFAPELRIVQKFGGMPLISTSNETVQFSWNEIGDLVSEYGVPLIFVYSVVQKSQNDTMIALSWDTLSNPTLFRPILTQNFEQVLEADFKASPKPFDVFLQTVTKNLLQYTNPDKPEEEVLSELDEMATFMRQLYAGGVQNGTILPLGSEVTLAQLQQWTDEQFPGMIDWIGYLSRVFQKSGVTIDAQVKLYHQSIERIYGTLNLVKQTDPKILKNFALLRVFLFQAPDSDTTTRKAFEEYYKAKNYILYPRWEYCTRKILDVVDTASLSYAVTYIYQKKHTSKVPQASKMIEDLRTTFESLVTESDWMDTESRDAALAKAKNILVLLGYPDFVNNQTTLDQFYQNLKVCEWDNYGNARAIRAFKQAYQFSQLGQNNRFFWGKSTFDPNAYYNRPNNKIVVPISMLSPVFFTGDNPILDYSRLGTIIGHEITHGFDINGKNYDQDGTLASWWSQETIENFHKKSQCFRDQYSQYEVPEVNRTINGSYCINENLADNGGIRVSFKAFKEFIQSHKITTSGNYTLEQLFFISFGTMWCSDESDYALNVILNTVNGYPPKRYRVIGSLSNLGEFSEAFGCPLGSSMNPEEKCRLW